MVKKAQARTSGSSGWPNRRAQPVSRAALRWKAPRVGERPSSSRKAGVARPSRCAHLASARREGGIVLPPRRSGQGTRAMTATRGARSDRGWGQVSVVSNHGGERRDSVSSRPLTLRTFGDCPGSKGNLRFKVAVVPTAYPGSLGCSSGPRSCSRRHLSAEVVEAHAALKASAKSGRTRV
jgi:hypothetical protein